MNAAYAIAPAATIREILFYFASFSLPGVLREIKLTVPEISADLRELVHTFR